MGRTDLSTVIPKVKGHYVLVLYLEAVRVIAIGRLGTFHFRSGFYGYVGSALGPGGLFGRVARHLEKRGKPRWHVDYLRALTDPVQVWLMPGENKRECFLSETLKQLPGCFLPVKKFGSTDCSCYSHLCHFPVAPSFEVFSSLVRCGRCPAAEPMKVDLL